MLTWAGEGVGAAAVCICVSVCVCVNTVCHRLFKCNMLLKKKGNMRVSRNIDIIIINLLQDKFLVLGRRKCMKAR